MSYGVWRKRGEGWSSIEIDSAGRDARYQWQDYADTYGEHAAVSRKRNFAKQGLGCGYNLWDCYVHDDFHYLSWASNQLKKGWHIHEVDTESDHSLWIAVAPVFDLTAAFTKLNLPLDTQTSIIGQRKERA